MSMTGLQPSGESISPIIIFFSQVSPNRTGSSSPFFHVAFREGYTRQSCVQSCTHALVYIHVCPSLSGSRHVTEPGQDPKLFCSEGFEGSLRTDSEPFSLKCFPHFPHYSHILGSCTLSVLPHHPFSKAQEEVCHLLHPDHPNTYGNSGNEVVS